jgi:hypothetical protein
MAISSMHVLENSILLGRHKPMFVGKEAKNKNLSPNDLIKVYSLEQASR